MKYVKIHLLIAGAPTLVVYEQAVAPEVCAQRGTVLFYHGFGERKEGYRGVLERFAQLGMLAIGIDGIGHGERRYPDFIERFPAITDETRGNPRYEASFLDVLSATVQELPAILDALIERGWAIPGHIGISGYSFGGFVSYAAIITDKRIVAAAPIVGSPQWLLPRPESPHLHLEKLYPVAVLSQNATLDTNIPAHYARDFHQALTPYYMQSPERLRYIEYPNSPHDLTRTDWQQAWSEAAHWLASFLITE